MVYKIEFYAYLPKYRYIFSSFWFKVGSGFFFFNGAGSGKKCWILIPHPCLQLKFFSALFLSSLSLSPTMWCRLYDDIYDDIYRTRGTCCWTLRRRWMTTWGTMTRREPGPSSLTISSSTLSQSSRANKKDSIHSYLDEHILFFLV